MKQLSTVSRVLETVHHILESSALLFLETEAAYTKYSIKEVQLHSNEIGG